LQGAKDGREVYMNWTRPRHIIFTENPNLLGLINILSSILGVPVFDETGL
jgi:hypothetical protein